MKNLLVFFVLILISYNIFGQDTKPFIINYSPSDYNGESQIWSIAQDKKGIMYFGSNQHLLIFDGSNWSRLDINKSANAIRSIAIDSSGRIYIGSVGEFGYLQISQNGVFKYVSLSKLLDSTERNFTDIWSLQISGKNVYFCATTGLFRYNKDAEKPLIKIDTLNSYFITYKIRNEIFVTVRGKGLKKIAGDSLLDLPMGNKINPWIMLPYEKDKYLLYTNKGLIVYNPKANDEKDILTKKFFDKEDIQKTDKFLKEQQIYLGAAYIGQQKYALSTIRSGIVIINKKGKILKIINKNSGLNSNTVQFLFKDNEEQLWAGLSYGISHVEINSPYEYIDEKDGIDGTIYHAYRFNHIFYVTSNLGIFFWDKNRFNPVPKLSGENALQVFNPTEFEYDKKKKFFTVTTVLGMLEVQKENVQSLNKLVPSGIVQSRFDSAKVWLSDDYDLYLSDLKEELKKPEKIYTFNSLITLIGQKDKDNLWLISNNKPLLFNVKTKKIFRFENNAGIKNIKFYNCEYLNKKNLFFTNNGLYIYRSNKFSSYNNFVDNVVYGKDITQFEKISDNEYWLNYAVNNRNRLAILRRENGKFIFDSIPFRRIHEPDQFYNDGDSIMWIISSQKLYCFRPNYKLNLSIRNNIIINKIIENDSVLFEGFDFTFWQKRHQKIELSFKNNDLRFYYSLPTYSAPEGVKYQYLLKGGKKSKWSQWSSQNFKEYTNLHEGDYVFEVRAKNIYERECKTVEFKFTILPPWYRSFWAYLFYFIAFIFIIWLAIKINSIRMKKENERLDRIVKERTAEINQQKEEIKTQADNLSEINILLTERNEEVNQQNEEIKAIAESLKAANENIKQKNKYITDSIQYAERIQKAVLPDDKKITNYFKEYFILFIPKDIISGDFYWIKRIKDHLLVAVADCTGHGVPGGFISMLAISLLNEIVRRDDIQTPKDALEKMRRLVKIALKQNDKEIKQYDGLDIAFADINTQTETLIFAGAYSPLFIVRNKKLTVYKPVLNPIGYYPFEKEFKNIEIKLEKDDFIYMFSDGYKDQLSPDNRTMNSRYFKEALIKYSDKSAVIQKQNLLDNLLEWKRNKKQTDDILILGFKWK